MGGYASSFSPTPRDSALATELRRVLTYSTKYDWPETGPPTDYLKKSPEMTQHFTEMVLSVQWDLTDEYSDDNATDALFSVVDREAESRGK